MSATIVYADGACLGNPGPGGWAYASPDGPFRSGAKNPTTNQRMEITAALRAVEDLDGDLEVISDSSYVVNCFRQRWWQGWLSRGWLNAQKKPVANRDLWEPLVRLVLQRQVSFSWVKGHSGDAMNDIVDRLAVEAAHTQRGRVGVGSPPDLGDRSEILVPGRRVAVFGHRPPELDGWGGGPLTEAVRDRLGSVLRAKGELHQGAVAITGLNLGVEQLAAETGIPYVAVLAFPGQEEPWPAASRRHYQDLLSGASQIIELSALKPANRIAFAKAFGQRDTEILSLADEAIVVWDGTSGAVGRQLDEAKSALGEEEVWVIELSELRERER
jgi:ribonuclease HI/uncharacterized phage-like protein YoqJ